jgi:plasmid stabilization system protein ParE
VRDVEYHPKAGSDARILVEFYEAVSKELGDEFWNELLAAIAYAREFPERHHFDGTGRRRGNLKRFPVHLLFLILPHAIRITAIRHDRQNPLYAVRRR